MIEKALIIQPMWLEKILKGEKTWEMRSTKTKVRGIIALIESGSGLIVGEVELVDSLDMIDKNGFYTNFEKHQIPGHFEQFKKWKFPWVLRNVKPYDKPIPYTHPRGAVIWVKLNN